MLKSNITNLQFILDNKPQYSISFDKQQEKNQVSWYFDFSVRYGIEIETEPNYRTS